MASACPFLRATPSPPDACYYYVDHDGEWSDEMKEQVRDGLAHVEEAMGKKLGDPEDPLLVSVRRGATVSMPRMMDSMLNLGLNDEVVVDLAEKVAESADFFSFGTNDLTQMTFGFSRDDAGTFLPYYVNEGLLERDPFQALDQEGIGELVRIASDRGRSTDESLKVGICGEHGGEPSSVSFCDETGLDYASCSPFRIPIARLVAAQSALEEAAHSPAASEEFMHSGGEVA